MSKAYRKEIRRSIQKGWKRFLSILIIAALGVGMLTGLYAACFDMYYSADRFFDRQKLFDIQVVSTLGLTQEDVEVLAQADGVETAEGAYSETVHTDIDGVRKSAEMTVLSLKGLNAPYLLEGTLPAKEGEIAVTQKYLQESGKSIGDTLTIEEDLGEEDKEDAEEAPAAADTEDNPDEGGVPDTDIDLELPADWEEETQAPTFANTTYTITGVITDPKDIRSDGNANAFRSAMSTDYTFFITAADAGNDIFTAVYITLDTTQDMNCYSEEYENAVRTVIGNIEAGIKAQREQARYDTVVAEARGKLEDAGITMNDKFAEADAKFADAWDDISEARQELSDGEITLSDEQKDAEEKIAEARAELESAKQELAEAEERLAQGEAQLIQGEVEWKENVRKLEDGRQQLAQEQRQAEEQFAAAEQQFHETQNRLDTARTQLETGTSQLKSTLGDAWPTDQWNALVNAAAALAAAGADDSAIAEGTAAEAAQLAAAIEQLNAQTAQSGTLPEAVVQAALGTGKVNGGQQALDAQKNAFSEQKDAALQKFFEAGAELDEGETQLEAARKTIDAKKAELEAGKAELTDGKAELSEGEAKLNAQESDAAERIADAWEEIADGKEELAEGEAELMEQEQEYAGKKEEARQKLADAYAKLDDITMAQWYVQDRTSLDSYSGFNSDLSSIEAIGKVFPVIFLSVAVLMSLTAMTRMVEEERGLIGIYKALGYGNAAVYQKYLLFAFTACLLGGVLGDLFGFIFMPEFVSAILDEELYTLPHYYLRFDILYGVGGVLLFMAGIVGATALACRSELTQMPAALMRPKAPHAGSRVFLERIPALWNRLKFLNKVTVRNLFRYKKRMFMTVGGVMGCTALILCGFAIKDSIADLAPKQYEHIYRYDLMAVAEEADNDALVRQLAADANIKDYLNLRIDSVKLGNAGGRSEKVHLMVIPEGAAIEEYIRIENSDGKLVSPDDNGVFITRNAAQILGLKPRDIVSLQNMELVQREAVISGVVQNYLGNTVYMTQKLYEALFEEYAPNGVLAHLSDTCTDQPAYAEALLDNAPVLSAVSTTKLEEIFGFDLIDAVVLLITVMAGGLAFVVLFTLSSTNISERVRELATIKVLGFYDNEVYQYVNKETLILSAAGILIGLPVGRMISAFLTTALNMPSIHFAVHVEPSSYLISAAITLCFAIIVDWMTNRTLNRIDMIEALKSVE
jgi:putative ABC transport system permease protein